MHLKFFPGTNFNFKKGITLAELVVSIGILATVLVIMMGTVIGGLEALQKGTALNHAMLIAQRTLENYRSMYYGDVPLYDPPDITWEGNFEIKTGVLQLTYPSAVPKNYKKLTVTVSNTGEAKGGKSVKVDLTTYLFPVY